jgi:hypothetical protein
MLGPGVHPADPGLLAHELTHVVQHRLGSGTAAGVGPMGPLEQEAAAAGAHARSGQAATVRSHGLVPAVQLDRQVFGAGQVLVTVADGVATVNGTAIGATVGADGRLWYNGREIVLDRSGVFRYRDRYTICRPCNPQYYEGPRRIPRPGTVVPEAQGSFYDPATREWRLRREPVVTTATLTTTPQAPPGPVDPRLQQRVELAQAAREQFEARVQRAMAEGNRTRVDAERLVRQRMQESVGPSGLGTFETGQTYAMVEEEIDTGLTRRTTTGAVQGGEVATVAVPSPQLKARVTQLNKMLGENFVFNEQTLNHAEVRAIVRVPGASTYYVNREMCPSCQRFFLLEAAAQNRPITVVDPTTTRVFTPNHQILEYHPTVVYERTAAVTRAGGVSKLEIGEHPAVTHSVRPVPRTGPPPASEVVSKAGEPTARPATGGAAVEAEGGAAARARGAGTAEGAEAPGRTRLPSAAEEVPGTAKIRPGVLEPETGLRPTGLRGAGRIRRFAMSASKAIALGVFTIVMLLVDVVIQLILIPYLERLRRMWEEEYRVRLQKQIQDYYDTRLGRRAENWILSRAEAIRMIEDTDAQPYVNTTVTVHFKRSWNWLTGQGYGPPESILDLEFVRLDGLNMEISDKPVEESSDPLEAEDTLPLIGDTFSTEFSQTVHFPSIPPTYQELVNEYGPNPSERATPTCFIATACYGTSEAPQVAVLRRFRDAHLMTHGAGRRFVRWYYRTSPPIADVLRRHALSRRAVRTLFVAPLAAIVQTCRLDRLQEDRPA